MFSLNDQDIEDFGIHFTRHVVLISTVGGAFIGAVSLYGHYLQVYKMPGDKSWHVDKQNVQFISREELDPEKYDNWVQRTLLERNDQDEQQ